MPAHSQNGTLSVVASSSLSTFYCRLPTSSGYPPAGRPINSAESALTNVYENKRFQVEQNPHLREIRGRVGRLQWRSTLRLPAKTGSARRPAAVDENRVAGD